MKKNGNAAEMIAMQMAQKDRIDAPWIEAGALHRQQGRRPAVEQKQLVRRFDKVTALIAPAAAKGIAAAENVQFHMVS